MRTDSIEWVLRNQLNARFLYLKYLKSTIDDNIRQRYESVVVGLFVMETVASDISVKSIPKIIIDIDIMQSKNFIYILNSNRNLTGPMNYSADFLNFIDGNPNSCPLSISRWWDYYYNFCNTDVFFIDAAIPCKFYIYFQV